MSLSIYYIIEYVFDLLATHVVGRVSLKVVFLNRRESQPIDRSFLLIDRLLNK